MTDQQGCGERVDEEAAPASGQEVETGFSGGREDRPAAEPPAALQPARAAHRGGERTFNLELFASCMPGLEQPLAAELHSFGIRRVRPLSGGVAFFSDVEGAYRACLWSRLASRIMLVVGRVNAGDADLLYAGVYDIPWEDIVDVQSSMAVRTHGTNAELRNSRFTSLKVKDAIVDRLRARRDGRPSIDTRAPRAAVDVRVHDARATISLDFSGEALNHRTYLSPRDSEDAALSCTIAAGTLALAGWAERAQQGSALVDPVCGDGILLVEAAQIACDAAPGLTRERWGFFGWAGHDADLWDDLLAEADERFERGLARVAGEAALTAGKNDRPDLARVRIAGASASSPLISRARDHVRRAGLRQAVSVEIGDAESVGELVERVTDVARKAAPEQPACAVVSRIDVAGRTDAAANIQREELTFVAACDAAPEGSLFALAGGADMPARFGAEPASTAQIGRDRVATPVAVFAGKPQGTHTIEVADAHGGAPHKVEVFEESSEQFAARLRKVWRERRKWARREGVSCLRVYDADLPGFSVAIDVYEGAGDARGNTYLHIAEYAPPASIDAGKARRRFNDVLTLAPVVMDVRPDHVFAKTRMHDKGGGQYRNAGTKPYRTTIEENGLQFEVDLAGHLDTGIFLDHRPTRELVRDHAQDARFLNLFAYTGTATVYAAAGGARETTTVDLSQTYLEWAQRNMERNGFSGPEHEYERADVMRWITEARRGGRRFDLVFVDPPTFSNSKAMGRRTWDVQRDHVELLIGVSRLLSEEGLAIFSCNLRTFKPALDELERYGVELEDISAQTIPHDFARTPRIHKCYLVRHVAK